MSMFGYLVVILIYGIPRLVGILIYWIPQILIGVALLWVTLLVARHVYEALRDGRG